MKKLKLTFLLPALCTFILSCGEEASDPEPIELNATLVQSMPVAVSSTNEMSVSVLLDATTDPEIEEYKDNIKSYEVKELLFSVENYEAPNELEVYFNGVLGFGSRSSAAPSASCDIEFYNITHVANTGDTEFSDCTQKANEVANLLLTDNGLKIYMVGNFSRAPVSFDLKVTINVTITANPL